MKGLKQVFTFTLKRQLEIKTVRTLTIVIALLLFILPAGIMTLTELRRGSSGTDDPGEEREAEDEEISCVYFCAEDEALDWKQLEEIKLPGMEDVPFIMAASPEEAAEMAAKDKNSLILWIRNEKNEYFVRSLIPEGSALHEDGESVFRLAGLCSVSMPVLKLALMGYSEEEAEAILAKVYEAEAAAAAEETEPDEPADDPADEEDDFLKEILGYVLPFLNIMLVYFLVLYYGQGTANSVIMEKTSKLMDTFLVSVPPKSMVLGKVLATWTASLMQFLIWILAGFGGIALGRSLVLAINPESPMAFLELLDLIKEGTRIFSLPEVLLAVAMILTGFLMYCTLAAIAGSFASKPEELSATIGIFSLVLVASYLVCLFMGVLGGGGEKGALWYDFVPFTAVLITPSRLMLGDVSFTAGLISWGITLALSFVFILLAGKVYSMMSLYKGKVPKLPQIIKMLRFS